MRAKIVDPIVIDTEDRTVQPTIQIFDERGNLLETTTDILIPIDGITQDIVVERLKNLLVVRITQASPIPLTQQQIETMLLGMIVAVPQ